MYSHFAVKSANRRSDPFWLTKTDSSGMTAYPE